VTIEELAHALGGAQRTTEGWRCWCAAHDDHNPSLYLKAGDKQPIVFVCRSAGCSQEAVIAALESRGLCPIQHEHRNGGGVAPTITPRERPKSEEELTAILPVPDDAKPPPMGIPKPRFRWEYRDAEGRLLGYVDRYDKPEGGKDIFPLTYCRSSSGSVGWRRKAFPTPRPLYGLDRLAAHPDLPVLVVEGEKSVDAATRMATGYISVCWPGGCKVVGMADLSPLKDRKEVVYWADNDADGRIAAENFRTKLLKLNSNLKIRVLKIPDDWPRKFDIADAEEKKNWTSQQVLAFIETESIPQDSDEQNLGDDGNRYFVSLGWDHTTYFYRSVQDPQVISISASGHMNHGNLLQLAPLVYWEAHYMGRTGVEWTAAANDVIQRCKAKGIYNPAENVRGRGAWLEDEESGARLVLHTGKRLYVNGRETPLHAHKSRYSYEADADLGLDLSKPLTDAEAKRILIVCRSLLWRKPVSGDMLAGWIVLAPFSGALVWRPHIWLTGTSGAGKSTVMRDIIRPLTAVAEYFEGATTSAGVRQSLRQDARPVIFDEAERNGTNSENRIQDLVELIMVASSGAGKISKGTTHQEAKSTITRSCFCLASINTALDRQGIARRITPLELLKNGDPNQYKVIKPEIAALPRGEALIARTMKHFRALQHNIETFRVAVAEYFHDQPEGDQFGPLMAGAYSLVGTRQLTLDEAAAYIKKREWDEHQLTEDERDESQITLRLIGHVVRLTRPAGALERTVGELIQIALGNKPDEDVGMREAYEQLMRISIGVAKDGGHVFIAERSEELSKIFKGTQWERNWRDSFERLPQTARNIYRKFAGGRMQKSISIPLPALFSTEAEKAA